MDLSKREQDEDRQAFLPKDEEDLSFSEKESRETTSKAKKYLRLGLEIVMAFAIVILLIRPYLHRGTVKSSPVPNFPKKTYTFLENPRYLHEGMFVNKTETLHTLHKWIELSADGRGYVKIDNAESYDLGEPYTLQMNATFEQPVYMVSAFHQLHCLSYLVDAFQTGLTGEMTQEILHHSTHCFDYIRQAIMCAADTSLEGKTGASPGWGSKHECKDYDALLAWTNKHTVVTFRRNMPEEAVL